MPEVRAQAVPVDRFLADGWPWLVREPVLNNVILTVLRSRQDSDPPHRHHDRWITVTAGTGGIVGAAMWTRPSAMMLAGSTRAAAEALAGYGAANAVPGVAGTANMVDWFDARCRALTGAAVTGGMNRRVFRLDSRTLAAPRAASGRPRQAEPSDRDLLIRWAGAFSAEALPGTPPADAAGPVDARLGRDGRLWLWEDGSEPVCMTWVTPPVAGVVRLSGVYTPPDRRGRGYASGCVAAASRYALGTSATTCMLYTDLANPTSNKIYQAIGYRPVADARELSYSAHPKD